MNVRIGLVCFGLALFGCSDDDAVSSEKEAELAYLGLDRMVEKAMDLGFAGFNAAKSATIDEQTAAGDVAGTIKVNGKVDQGSSDNKGMRLVVALLDYSDEKAPNSQDPRITYVTGTTLPMLDMSLKKIPTGTMEGTLNGTFSMSGELKGQVLLNLTLSSDLEADSGGAGGVKRKTGTVKVTGTATSDYGVYQVNVTR